MNTIIRKGMVSVITALLPLQSWGQEKGIDVDIDINKKESNWYQQPWVWIVGGAVFILILVALLRGGGKKE
jgi:hypothetical protein